MATNHRKTEVQLAPETSWTWKMMGGAQYVICMKQNLSKLRMSICSRSLRRYINDSSYLLLAEECEWGNGQNREVISHSRKKFAQENESYVEVWWLHCLLFPLAGGEEDRLCARQASLPYVRGYGAAGLRCRTG